MRNKKFTLIELIIVIGILAILASLVMPNIKGIESEAKGVALASDQDALQIAVDMYKVDNIGDPILPDETTGEIEDILIGEPGVLDMAKLYPDYIRDLPSNLEAKFWLDYTGKVWVSLADAPVSFTNNSGALSWNAVNGAVEYIVYEYSEVGSKIKYNVTEVAHTKTTEYAGESGKNYIIQSIDKLNNKSVLVGSEYTGYPEKNKIFEKFKEFYPLAKKEEIANIEVSSNENIYSDGAEALIDGITIDYKNNAWIANMDDSMPQSVIFEFSEKKSLRSFSIEATDYTPGMPKEMKLYMFEADNWVEVKHVVNQIDWIGYEKREFYLDEPINSNKYKIEILENNRPENITIIAELYLNENIYTETKVPKLTSNNSHGTAFTNSIYSSNYDAFKGFNQNPLGLWNTSSSIKEVYLGYEFLEPININMYSIKATSSSVDISSSPRNWRFEASVNGLDWNVLDTEENVLYAKSETKKFAINNENKYKYYRIYVLENNGGPYSAIIDELGLHQYR